MRPRPEIEKSGLRKDILTVEVLLDIRDLLAKLLKAKKPASKRKPKHADL